MTSTIRPDLSFIDRPALRDVRWTTLTGAADGIVVPSGLSSFSTVRVVLEVLSARLGGLPPDLRAEHERALRQTVPEVIGMPGAETGSFYNAENVSSSVVRRISRESIHLSDAVDGLARLLLELSSRLEALEAGTFAGPVLRLVHAERIDRPSIRVLYRMTQLTSESLRWVWEFGSPVLQSDDGPPIDDFFVRRFLRSRHRLFTFLIDRLDPRIERSPVGEPYLPRLDSPPTGVDRAVAAQLVGQNYDLAYLCAMTAELPAGDTLGHVYRMLCIIDANVGEIDSAAESIGLALASAASPLLRAHCHYMTGLLLTKRRYDLDAADEQYRLGLELLPEPGKADEAALVERAWLINGRSFVRALRSKSLPAAERDLVIKQTFVDEAGAYRMVAHQGSLPALYLQLNLLANLTLLLEINGDHARAAHFWAQVFDKFRGTGSEDQIAFEIAFHYRLGMLLFKAGDVADARKHLAAATDLSNPEQQRFTIERVTYACAYVELKAGDSAAALAIFAGGAALAAELRDPEQLVQQARGAAAAADAGGDREEAAYWNGVVERALTVYNEPKQHAGESTLRVPAPKFPSYVPLIDLEATPIIDLNRYLANDISEQSLSDVVQKRQNAGSQA